MGFLAACAAALLAYVLLIVVYNLSQRWKLRGIPGPPSNLFVGNLPEVAKKGMHVAVQEWAKQYGPVLTFSFAKQPQVVVTDTALIRTVCVKRFAVFTNRMEFPWIPLPPHVRRSVASELLFARAPLWGSLRAALQPFFHNAALTSYAGDMNASACKLRALLSERAAAGASVDVWRYVGRLALDVVGKAAFGFDFGALQPLHERGEGGMDGEPDSYIVSAVRSVFEEGDFFGDPGFLGVLSLISPPGPAQIWEYIGTTLLPNKKARAFLAARTKVFSTADFLYTNAQRRAAEAGAPVRPPDDSWKWWTPADVKSNPYKDYVPSEGSLVDILAKGKSKANDGQLLANVDVVSNIYEMMAAGYETTANTLAFALYCLATTPDATAALVAEVDAWGGPEAGVEMADVSGGFPYARAVIRETLRLFPAAPIVGRVAAADIMLGGHLIPAGTNVLLGLCTVMRDPQVFEDPERFWPERWLKGDQRLEDSFMAFGVGPRNCIGYRFAMEEATIALLRLYQGLTFELDERAHPKGELKTSFGITLKPDLGVHVYPRLRAGRV